MNLINYCKIVTKNTNLIAKKSFSKSSYLRADCGENVKRTLLCPVQKEPPKKVRKISVIGAAGNVGQAIMYTLVRKSICDELVIVESPNAKERSCGEALDFVHAQTFIRRSPKIKLGFNAKDATNSDVIIVTCGKPRQPGKSRRDIAQVNVDLMKEVIPPLADCSPDAVFVVVTNPVDIVAYSVWKYSCFDKNRIVGVGVTTDTARFRHYAAERLGINSHAVHMYTAGEHGEACVPLWSLSNVAGQRLRDIDPKFGKKDDPNDWFAVFKSAQAAGGIMNTTKGWSNYCVSTVTTDMVTDILSDARRIHYGCVNAQGYLDIKTQCFMSFPIVLGNRGATAIVQQKYTENELKKIEVADIEVDKVLKTIKF